METMETQNGTLTAYFYNLESGLFWATFLNGRLTSVVEVTENNVLIETLF